MAVDRDFFVDIFEEVVEAVRVDYNPVQTDYNFPALMPYYDYGHIREVANRLSLKNDGTLKFQKFPLIVLITDLKKDYEEDDPNILYTLSPFDVLIVDSTESTYTSQERTENTFKPILNPIKKLLIQKMIESPIIITPKQRLGHGHIDKYGWGNETVYGSEGLLFNSYLDAIQIPFSDIKVRPNKIECSTIA